MALTKPADGVVFAEDSVEKSYLSLPEDNNIRKSIKRAIDRLKQNIFSGENIPKKQIPKGYIQKYKIDNLWWYPLPDGWRLIYSIVSDKVEILAVILEYFDHKNYARRFGYKK